MGLERIFLPVTLGMVLTPLGLAAGEGLNQYISHVGTTLGGGPDLPVAAALGIDMIFVYHTFMIGAKLGMICNAAAGLLLEDLYKTNSKSRKVLDFLAKSVDTKRELYRAGNVIKKKWDSRGKK